MKVISAKQGFLQVAERRSLPQQMPAAVDKLLNTEDWSLASNCPEFPLQGHSVACVMHQFKLTGLAPDCQRWRIVFSSSA